MPVASMTLLSFVSYVDRSVLATLVTTIMADTGITAEGYGRVISAFSVAYAVGNPAWGRVLDRFGVRWGLALAAALWTCASAAHAFAGTVTAFALARAALGFGEGATFPGGLRVATQTLRADEQGRGIAVAYSGGSLGAVVAPLLITPIGLAWGWRSAFLCTGGFGAAWLAIWALVARDARLGGAAPRADASRGAPAPRLGDASVWGFMAAYGFGGLPLGFVLYFTPVYLGHALGRDQATIGRLLFIPPLGWEVGYFFWGWIVDRSTRRGGAGPTFFARIFALLAALAMPLALTSYVHSLATVLVVLFLAMFVSAGFVIVSLAEATRRHTGEHGAYLAGLGAGSWSALMIPATPLFGRLFDAQRYGAAFALAAAAPVVAWLVWRALTSFAVARRAETARY